MNKIMDYKKRINEDYLDDISQEDITVKADAGDTQTDKKSMRNVLSFEFYINRKCDAEDLREQLTFFEKRYLRAMDNFHGVTQWVNDGFFYLEKKGDFQWLPFTLDET